MKKKALKLLISMIALALVIACSSQKPITPQQTNAVGPSLTEPTPEPSQSSIDVVKEPILIPSGYQMIEATSFKIAIPEEWTYEESSSYDLYTFKKGEKEIGQTEILGWFDSSSWNDMKPNHSEQNEFLEVEGLININEMNVHTYKIQLTHTKPAADQDPNWEFKETRWYVTVKEQERSYGFYFSSNDVEENIMKTIVSTFQLK